MTFINACYIIIEIKEGDNIKKIRPNYVEKFSYEKEDYSNKKAECYASTLQDKSDGLYYDKINYLTFDELEYLFETTDKNDPIYQDILSKYNQTFALLKQFYSCYYNNNLNLISYEGREKIRILLGFKTDNDIFKGIKKTYEENPFTFTKEETEMKNALNQSIIINRINESRFKVFNITMCKYRAILSSFIFFTKENKESFTDEQFNSMIKLILFGDIEKYGHYFMSNILSKLVDDYEIEKDNLEKAILYNIILDMNEEIEFINTLLKNNSKLLFNMKLQDLLYYYNKGNGISKKLKDGTKINIIKPENIEKLLKIIEIKKKKLPDFEEKNKNSYQSKKIGRKIIPFKDRKN